MREKKPIANGTKKAARCFHMLFLEKLNKIFDERRNFHELVILVCSTHARTNILSFLLKNVISPLFSCTVWSQQRRSKESTPQKCLFKRGEKINCYTVGAASIVYFPTHSHEVAQTE
jgi:hypothetical protein